jgi:hypothetical protein
MPGGFTSLARDLDAPVIQLRYAVLHSQLRKLVSIRSKCIGFNQLCARLNICLVKAENGFGVGGVQFVYRSLLTDCIVQKGPHGPIGNEYSLL